MNIAYSIVRSVRLAIQPAILAAFGLFLTGCTTTARANAAPPILKTYVNVRFSYAACYPASHLIPQGEAPDGDGEAFLGADGAKLLVYGSFNFSHIDLPAALAKAKRNLIAAGGIVSYERLTPGFFVMSGTESGTIVYEKKLLDGPAFKTIWLQYPITQRSTFDPLVAHMAHCFSNTSFP